MATDDNTSSSSDAYEVIAASRKPMDRLDLDGKEYKFRNNGMFRMKDRGEAMALREKYGKDITVTKVNYPTAHDRGHRYFFGQLTKPLPWHKYDEFGKRIEETNSCKDVPFKDATENITPEGGACCTTTDGENTEIQKP